ncbi:hypothetical protein JW933_08090 [candidate division FCPU426 bacterium]|nr:hypothetical protein [candidate division FCPU426 bacterium]
MAGILIWWVLISVIGLMAMPMTLKMFEFLPDRGYGFAKPVGLLLLGFLVWIFGFFQFSLLSILLVFILLSGFSYWLWKKNQTEMMVFIQERWGHILVVELFFTALFFLFIFFRMYNPDIVGTEKFMDMAFMNAMTRADAFPPYDPWLSGRGFFISYYYFGYLWMSILTKVSGVAPAVGFNLSLALLFALSGVSTFTVIYNLTRRLSLSLGGWAAIYLLGNLDGFRQVLVTKSVENFNWWTPSRVIPDTINEFPFFSYLLGDMHPHMLAVPVFMAVLGMALNHLKSWQREVSIKAPDQLGRVVLWGLAIGSLGFINSWDLPTTFFIAVLAIVWQQYRQRPNIAALPWTQMLSLAGVMLGMMFVPYIPFYIHFHSQAKGIAWTTQNTRIGDFLLIFGLFVFLILTFLAARYHHWFITLLAGEQPKKAGKEKQAVAQHCPRCGGSIREGKRICGKCGYRLAAAEGPTDETGPFIRPLAELPGWLRDYFYFILQPAVVWRQGKGRLGALYLGLALLVLTAAVLLKIIFFSAEGNPQPYLLGLAILFIFAVFALLAAKIDNPETMFTLMLLLTAGLLIFGCETLHINDTFTPPLDRMNTVFKFYYQCWFLLGLASVYGIYWTFTHSLRSANLKVAWMIPVVMLVAASLVYPYASTMVKTNHFSNVTTLDGSYYLKNIYPADRAGIEWLRTNVKGRPVVLEATGGEYTDFARVSTFTGLPTVLGWGGHELQWRGNYDEPSKRIPDIDTLYGSADTAAVRALLDKYDIMFVFVGTLERQKYPEADLDKFAQFMDIAYEHPGGVRIYRRR